LRPSEPIYDEAFRRSTLSANPIWLNWDATRPRTVAECPEWAYCGRRVAVLYAAGDLFACRHCYRLCYASQQESRQSRFIRRSRKIRMRLGGSPDLLQPFPKRPPGMHQRTYMRLRARDPFVATRRGMVEVAELRGC
jgi:hypothetical protein